MLCLRVRPSTRPWSSIRLASRLSQGRADGQRSSMFSGGPPTRTDIKHKAAATVPDVAESGDTPSSLLSRLSNRTQHRVRRNSNTKRKSPSAHHDITPAASRKPRRQATSFISARSAQHRDHAAEKWFTDVQELDIDSVDQSSGLKSRPHKERTTSKRPKRREMRPRADLNALFSPTIACSAASLRLQTKRELGGDYTSYLPDGYADPYRLPIDYARLVLGRNKHVPLNAQTGALNIVEEAVRGKITRQSKQASTVAISLVHF